MNVASSVSFAIGLPINERSTDDLKVTAEARKMERITSLKSFIEQEQRVTQGSRMRPSSID